jgi:hypothetical protein
MIFKIIEDVNFVTFCFSSLAKLQGALQPVSKVFIKLLTAIILLRVITSKQTMPKSITRFMAGTLGKRQPIVILHGGF